jgi:hypothetical protein
LPPLLEKAHDEYKEEQKQSQTNTNTTEAGVKVASPSGGPELNLSKKSTDELKTEHGMNFTKQKDTEVLIPSEIYVYRLSQSWQTSSFESLQQIFLRTGTSTSYTEDSPVTSQFTTATLKDLGNLDGGLKPFAGFWPGMMICQLSTVLPPGFVWADGKSSWPDENWVPMHLRGKPLPNMSGTLVGGTTDETQIGLVWNQGKIQLPPSFLRETAGTEQSKPRLYALDYSDLPIVASQPNDSSGIKRGYFLQLWTDSVPMGSGITWFVPASPIAGDHGMLRLREVISPTYKYDIVNPTISLDSPSDNPMNFQCRWMIKIR